MGATTLFGTETIEDIQKRMEAVAKLEDKARMERSEVDKKFREYGKERIRLQGILCELLQNGRAKK